jgi:predicted nucleotidyltransferase
MSVPAHMLLQNYLESLLSSKVTLRVVKTLARYTGRVFTIRKLAEAADVSTSETAKVVQELEKYGIVSIQPVGRAYLISLNKMNYFVRRILKPIIEAEEDTVDELVLILKRHLAHKSIVSSALFGSVARGQARKDSDIDLLVICKSPDAALDLVSKANEEVSSVFNGRLSPLVMSMKEFKSKEKGLLVKSILESYIHVAGRNLRTIAGRH